MSDEAWAAAKASYTARLRGIDAYRVSRQERYRLAMVRAYGGGR